MMTSRSSLSSFAGRRFLATAAVAVLVSCAPSSAPAQNLPTLAQLWKVEPTAVDWMARPAIVKALGLPERRVKIFTEGSYTKHAMISAGDDHLVPDHVHVVTGTQLFGMDPVTHEHKATDTTRWTVVRVHAKALLELGHPGPAPALEELWRAHPSWLADKGPRVLVVEIRKTPTGSFECTYMRPHEGMNLAEPLAARKVSRVLADVAMRGYVPAPRDESRTMKYSVIAPK